jgi:4-alpha-glucanotransferase
MRRRHAGSERCTIEVTIHDLAAAAGVLTEWVDVWGAPQQVAPDDLAATLCALTGHELESSSQIAAALAETVARNEQPPPVVVAWDGHLPALSIGGRGSYALVVTEDGTEVGVRVEDGVVIHDEALPFGYHDLHVGPGNRAIRIISAPHLAHPAPQRKVGILAPVYSLRSEESDIGIGHFGLLRQLADIALVAGTSVVGTLPLVATFPDQPSPYAPASRRAWNEILVDLTAAPSWNGRLPAPPHDPNWVQYGTTGDAVRAALAAYAKEVAHIPQIRDEIDDFAAANPELLRYSEFRARADEMGRNWRVWPQNSTPDPERVRYHLTGQWLADSQLKGLNNTLRSRGQYLYLDLPIGCNPDGYDIWDKSDLYAPAGLGAPPDSLFLGGQAWGLPALIPHRSRSDGHEVFIKAVRHQLSVSGLLRIDHVMGLHRAWWVPDGLAATQGAYVLQPNDELFAIVCLESHRAAAAVVGENLGTVPPAVTEALERHRLLGMKVAQDGLKMPSEHELIALSTHDTAPLAAWWKGLDIDDGEDLGVYTDDRADTARQARSDTVAYLEEIFGTSGFADTRDAILEWMATSPAAIALVSIDDLWAEERRQNVPGTDTERPNWRARHALTVEEIAASDEIRGRLERLNELRIG